MPRPYSRSPSALFQAHLHDALFQAQLHDAPLNNDVARGHSGVQPVRYRDVVISIDTDTLVAGSRLQVADVDWSACVIRTFIDDDDADSNIVLCESTFRLHCAGLASAEYAEEIQAFIRRGHSLTEPKCSCYHGLTVERAMQLGVSAERDGSSCPCHRVASITPAMISREIAVDNYVDYVDAAGVSLQSLMGTKSYETASSRITTPAVLLCQLREIWPFPLLMPSPNNSYAGIERDARKLQSKGQIAMLPSIHDGQWSLFFVDDMGMRVDQDVKQTWFSCS